MIVCYTEDNFVIAPFCTEVRKSYCLDVEYDKVSRNIPKLTDQLFYCWLTELSWEGFLLAVMRQDTRSPGASLMALHKDFSLIWRVAHVNVAAS